MISSEATTAIINKDGERKIVLDKERTLRMDFNALVKAEELTGKNFLEPATWQGLTAKDERILAYACLLDEDPTLTLEAVGRMMTPKSEKQIGTALFDLYIGETSALTEEETTKQAPFTRDGGDGGQSGG